LLKYMNKLHMTVSLYRKLEQQDDDISQFCNDLLTIDAQTLI
jgi:hypothetical protein